MKWKESKEREVEERKEWIDKCREKNTRKSEKRFGRGK